MLKEISYQDLKLHPMTLISDESMALSSGDESSYNAMTCSWGHLGALWGDGKGLPTSIVYVRPQRYTLEFIEKNEYYSLSFFDKEYRKDLAYLGSHSGRDEDKISKTNLTPVFEEKSPYFEEAKLVLICRKLYQGRLEEEHFINKKIMKDNYPEKDYHHVFIGEIVKVLIQE